MIFYSSQRHTRHRISKCISHLGIPCNLAGSQPGVQFLNVVQAAPALIAYNYGLLQRSACAHLAMPLSKLVRCMAASSGCERLPRLTKRECRSPAGLPRLPQRCIAAMVRGASYLLRRLTSSCDMLFARWPICSSSRHESFRVQAFEAHLQRAILLTCCPAGNKPQQPPGACLP